MFGLLSKQKKYLKKRIKAAQNEVWDFELKRFMMRKVRERIWNDYNNAKGHLDKIQTNIKELSPKYLGTPEDIEANKLLENDEKENATRDGYFDFKRLIDETVLLKRKLGRNESDMKGIDIALEGAKPSIEIPEGHKGIRESINDGLVLIQDIKNYLKTL